MKPRRGNAEPRMRGLWMHSLHYLNVWHYSCPLTFDRVYHLVLDIPIQHHETMRRLPFAITLRRGRFFVSRPRCLRYNPPSSSCPTLSLTKFLKFRAVSLCTDRYYLRAPTSSLANYLIKPSSRLYPLSPRYVKSKFRSKFIISPFSETLLI